MIIDSITKSYGVKTVLSGVSLSLMPGDRLGVVGANGSGKSTLLKIIAGEIDPDSGTVSIPESVVVGYLEQTINLPASSTVDDLLNHALDHLVELESRMRELEVAMGTAHDIDPVLTEYGQVTEQFEMLGGYEVDSRIEAVLHGLGLGEMPRERTIGTLSGGENARVALAGLLVQSPDILLLDEPTNHLDAGMLAWLEDYLRGYRGTVLVVSHDRQFLNRTVNRILAIDEHSHEGKLYTGNYDDYRVMRQQEIDRWRRDYADQQAELKALQMALKTTAHQNSNYRAHTDNDQYVYGYRVSKHDSTVSKRVRSVEEKLKRIEADPIPKPPEDLQFEADFDPSQLYGRFALEATGLYHAYGDRVILNNVNLALRGGDRLVIVGDNGAGKSTLIKVLTGYHTPTKGQIYFEDKPVDISSPHDARELGIETVYQDLALVP
ncbi:MAG: ATP-binding cassette domain-containing protein, partial [Chloroflexi bacterium]|nr:ATP-binding cassette domain-containing protein [Chloroflexota bacterium]